MSPPAGKASPPPAGVDLNQALAQQLEQFRAAGRQGKADRDLKIELAKPDPNR